MYPVREQNKINKRKAILEAAIKLFSRKGYDQTSIEELAREAGIGKGTVYSYFQTKKEIVRAFCEEELDYTRSQLAAHTNSDSSLQEQLLVLFMAEFTHITENRDFGRIYLQESVFPREHHGAADLEMQNQYFEMLYPIYRKAQRRGELSSDLELLHIAGHFYALKLLILSCWYNGMIPTEEIPEAMTTLINQVIDGLKPKTAKVIAR
ncbi:MAG: TetR/AcrR family transcriptional regulator [Desulfofustis sp.]|nr:TetR/AcrR family transcriptional regulator [Desulfofustis sp.]